MRHKAVLIGISLGFGLAVFVLLFLVSLLAPAVPALVAVLAGAAVFFYSLCVTFITYRRGGQVLARLCAQVDDEAVLYGDIASLMDRRREHTGALVVTRQRLQFETPQNRKGAVTRLDFDLLRVHLVQNVRGTLHLAANGRSYRFKVYGCDTLVATVRSAIDARLEQTAAQQP